MATKNLSIRIDNETLDKLHYIASYEGRSANRQTVYLIRRCIENFEHKNGEIIIKSENKETL